jgi:hypothetical protein
MAENEENELTQIVTAMKESMEESIKSVEPFTNNLEFNNSCLLITILFLLLFIYKKEVIKFFN